MKLGSPGYVSQPEHETVKENYSAGLSLLALIRNSTPSVELLIFTAAKTFICHHEGHGLLALGYVKDKACHMHSLCLVLSWCKTAVQLWGYDEFIGKYIGAVQYAKGLQLGKPT